MNRFSLRLRQSNPFYFLSAACMLGGCLLITSARTYSNIPAAGDLWLAAILNVYEAALIALAWFLVRRCGLMHDGAVLLALEAFFLVDVTFLNAEAITGNFIPGVALNILLFMAAMLKLFCMMKIAGVSPRDGRFAAIAVQLAAIFIVPFVFRHFDHGDLSTRFFYAAWWAVGLFIPACFTLSQLRSPALAQSQFNGIVRLLCVLPWLSFVMHVGILHYVYRVDFFAAEVAPVLLGLACLMHHVRPSRFVSRGELFFLKITLPMAAVVVSLFDADALSIAIGKSGRFVLTPAELGAAGAYLAYIYCFARPYAVQCIAAGAAAGLAYCLGPSSQQLGESIGKCWNWVSSAVWSVIPKTAISGGIAAIAAAFAFLGLGAAVSLRRRSNKSGS